eukprot:CAMPEP_0119559488 /NCGR_PEP_ID=MMETSP1352-20130426/12740_1 /TAXON_ID=265584 /ORGANISM="Stauroneis constricta, Strain CCMP1120" /LENGTH=51 /DNA_ID=CAMNT_0007607207 /DNA_START=25 /DNA_END=177 /DNA_ORIENTATION=-
MPMRAANADTCRVVNADAQKECRCVPQMPMLSPSAAAVLQFRHHQCLPLFA